MSYSKEQREELIVYFMITMINIYGFINAKEFYEFVCDSIEEISEQELISIYNKLHMEADMVYLIDYDKDLENAMFISGMFYNDGKLMLDMYERSYESSTHFMMHPYYEIDKKTFTNYLRFDYYEKNSDYKKLRQLLQYDKHLKRELFDELIVNLIIDYKMFGMDFFQLDNSIDDICELENIELNKDDKHNIFEYLINLLENQRSWAYSGNKVNELEGFVSFNHPLSFDLLLNLKDPNLEEIEKKINSGYYGDVDEANALFDQIAVAFYNRPEMKEIIEEEKQNNVFVN